MVSSNSVRPIYASLDIVSTMMSMSASTIQRLVRDGGFPKPRQLSGHRVAWLVRELDEWAESRPVSELLPPPNTGAKKPRAAIMIQDTRITS